MRKVRCPLNEKGYRMWWHATDEHPYHIIKYTSRPRKNQTHIRILQFIAACQYDKTNPYLPSRTEILMHVKCWPKSWAKIHRGQYSNIFANLLHKDFIRYDDEYRYSITADGLARLLAANENH